jgi:peptide/nickel transport system substrate-binding protein
MRLLPLIGSIAALLGGCQKSEADRTLRVSVIGTSLTAPKDPRAPLPLPAAMMADATGGGLVRIDRDGQVIAGAAIRWAILDDGLDYIFRIDDTAGATALDIARRLRAAIKAYRRDPQGRLLDAIESVAAVTGTVVEIRLTTPQPDLLILLAQPEYGVGARGAMRAEAQGPEQVLLHPRARIDPRPDPVLLRAETAGSAVKRFADDAADLVLGGTFDNLPLARAAEPRRGTLRFDTATGLFGLVLRDASSPAGARGLREALSLAIDRDAITAAIGATGLAKATTLSGSTIESPLTERRTAAVQLMAERRPALRVAMPAGPGGRRLFELLARDWAVIGVTATAVAADAPADLALVDRVTPPGSRAVLACALAAGCDSGDRLALIDPPYIPIAAPVRWSLVAQKLEGYEENGLAAHPLDRLGAK